MSADVKQHNCAVCRQLVKKGWTNSLCKACLDYHELQHTRSRKSETQVRKDSGTERGVYNGRSYHD